MMMLSLTIERIIEMEDSLAYQLFVFCLYGVLLGHSI